MLIRKVRALINLLHDIRSRLEFVQIALGRVEERQVRATSARIFHESEYKVFSQWGEDGLIQRLIQEIPIQNTLFVEFGVQDYTEANTRYLLVNNNWSGLVIDGDAQHIASIRQSSIYWRYNLKAECAFIDRDNINVLISSAGISGDIGLLSVDLDGNDYWVWEAINSILPRIVILEYNALFGPRAALSVPYEPEFIRSHAHSSNLYWGASLTALTQLSNQKGYALVGCNSSGNNAFFVRRDVLGGLQEVTAEKAFIAAQFRESRDAGGNATFLDRESALRLIVSMDVWDFGQGRLAQLGQCVRE